METQNYWPENHADKNKQKSIHAFTFLEISSSLQDIMCCLSELATVTKESRFKQMVNSLHL